MAHLESLLLADSNPRSRDALVFGFEREGVKVQLVKGPDGLGDAVRTQRPQLLIASLQHLDAADAQALLVEIGRLRDEPGTRDLPIVVVGTREHREDALRAGADEFVALPAFIRDVVTLSRLAVSIRQDGNDSGVAASLDEYGLYFLIRGLAVASRSGVLELERGSRSAEVHLVRGEVVAARLGKLSGKEAFEQLVLWSEATLHFRFVTPTGEREITESVEQLLDHGAAFAKEFEAAASRVGGARAVYRVEGTRAGRVRAHIPPEVQDFIGVFDGSQSLLDIIEESPWKPVDTVKVAFRLFQLGAIERRDQHRDGPHLTAQLAVRDWLLGVGTDEPRQTVTAVGRRAAEAWAEEEERRSQEKAPAEDLFGETDRVWKDAAAGDTGETDRVPKVVAEPVASSAKTGPIKKTGGRSERRKKSQPVAKEQRSSPDRRRKKSAAPPPVPEVDTPKPLVDTPLAAIAHPAPKSTPAPGKHTQMAFDDVEEQFFAQEAELGHVAPVESFEDLESSPKLKVPPKRGWFGLGKKK